MAGPAGGTGPRNGYHRADRAWVKVPRTSTAAAKPRGQVRGCAGLFKNQLAGRGLAAGDLNNDGAMDAAINCNDSPAVLLLNAKSGRDHWLSVNTVGSKSNRDGIGARIRLLLGS